MTASTTRPPRFASLRHDLQARLTARKARLTLERELASYTSMADQHELDAILARHHPRETTEIRRILARQRTR